MYPFVRLSNDGIWTVSADEPILTNKDYGRQRLKEIRAIGKFREDVRAELNDVQTAEQVIHHLLYENFPDSMHEDILNAIGWESDQGWAISKRRKRDPAFRESILEAYGRKCAICGYHVRRGDQLVGLEAAHIKWHQAGGPDIEQNGMAMCTMHHKLFDYGLFAIDQDLLVKVSTKANGGFGLKQWLLDYHYKSVSLPSKASHYPEQEFIMWQVNEVFKGDYRD
jgi:putative restriction endonuclease